jgi:hypothetical protein
MKYFRDVITALSVTVSFILISLLSRTCNSDLNYLSEIERLKGIVTEFKIKKDSDSKTILSQELNLSSYKRRIDSLQIINSTFSGSVQSSTIIKTEIQLAKPETILVDKVVLTLPQPFFKKDKHYTIGGLITKEAVLRFDSILINTGFSFAVGDTIRRGVFNKLFKVKDSVFRLRFDNPYIKVTSTSNYVYQKKRHWTEHPLTTLGIGLASGYVIGKMYNPKN